LPTTIHPPWVWVAVPSLPVTVKWQKPGVLPAFTVMVPGCVVAMVALLSAGEPLQAAAPSYASKTAEVSVTLALPLKIAG